MSTRFYKNNLYIYNIIFTTNYTYLSDIALFENNIVDIVYIPLKHKRRSSIESNIKNKYTYRILNTVKPLLSKLRTPLFRGGASGPASQAMA